MKALAFALAIAITAITAGASSAGSEKFYLDGPRAAVPGTPYGTITFRASLTRPSARPQFARLVLRCGPSETLLFGDTVLVDGEGVFISGPYVSPATCRAWLYVPDHNGDPDPTRRESNIRAFFLP